MITLDEVDDAIAVDAITQPEFRALAAEIVATGVASFERAVSHLHDPIAYPLPFEHGSYEQLSFRALQRMQPPAGGRLLTQALPRLKARTAARTGALATIDLRSPVPIYQQLRLRTLPRPSIDVARLTETTPLDTGGPSASRRASTAHLRYLEFVVHDVTCVDEATEWSAHEGMDIASVRIAPTGAVLATGDVDLGPFDEGQIRNFADGLDLGVFDLRLGGPHWPKHYAVVVILAEAAWGTMDEFIGDLVDRVREDLEEALAGQGVEPPSTAQDLLPWLDAAADSFGGVPGFIAAIAAEIAHLVLQLFDNQVFMPRVVTATVQNPDNLFSSGTIESSRHLLRFVGHGGEYRVSYSWRKRPGG